MINLNEFNEERSDKVAGKIEVLDLSSDLTMANTSTGICCRVTSPLND